MWTRVPVSLPMLCRILAAVLLLAASRPAAAHEGAPVTPEELLRTWEFDPLIVTGLILSAFLYARGASRKRGIQGWEQACFWGGWFFTAVALVSPLHPWGEALFSAHMVQHEILMALSAPLLVLGRPLVPFLWALPESWRGGVGRAFTRGWPARTWAFLVTPLVAWLLHFVALWAWHIPVLFEATLTSDLVHSLQHISFFVTALIFWWSVICGHARERFISGVFYLFTTVIHTCVLGALLTFSTQLWYPLYSASTEPWGLTPLEDQQLGGLIMWVPASLAYVIAGLALVAWGLRERTEPGLVESRETPA
jgi:putative membrane protein